jgi:hypothetical protein
MRQTGAPRVLDRRWGDLSRNVWAVAANSAKSVPDQAQGGNNDDSRDNQIIFTKGKCPARARRL